MSHNICRSHTRVDTAHVYAKYEYRALGAPPPASTSSSDEDEARVVPDWDAITAWRNNDKEVEARLLAEVAQELVSHNS